MATHSVLRLSRSAHLDSRYIPPLFLAPALQPFRLLTSPNPPSQPHQHPFSTTPNPQVRLRNREKNKSRGVSAIHRTGPRVPLSVSKYALPEPVWDPPSRKEFKTRHDHGLWGFFNEGRTAMTTPEDLDAHGRAWAESELVNKDWDDLWRIWWKCVKERNWLSTDANERSRVDAGYGDAEGQERDGLVKETMLRVRKVLLDRHKAFEEAIQMNGSVEFWKEELLAEKGKGDQFEPDDILERLETGKPMVDDAPSIKVEGSQQPKAAEQTDAGLR